MQGGRITASAATTNLSASFDATIENEIEASYHGVQGGIDFGCYESRFGGWDITGGLVFAANTGSSSQTMLSPNSQIGGKPVATGKLDADFDQYSVGAYLAAARGPVIGDLQLRYDHAFFEFTDTPYDGAVGLGLDDTLVQSRAISLAGSLAYIHALEDLGIAISPVIGFALTRTGSTTVKMAGNTEIETGAFDTRLGYVGALIGKNFVAANGSSASTAFLSATMYNDFADARKSVFRTPSDAQDLESENLGSFGEVSIGWNHLSLLGDSGVADARQLDAGIRADYRFSDSLTSYGLTGYMRFQF